jgi:transcriptional regulator of acetoin/glycerol metabolism
MKMGTTFKSENYKGDWIRFVDRHTSPVNVSPLIAISWERCWSHISPNARTPLQTLADDDLLSAQVVYFQLLSIARPIMEDIFQYIENPNAAILIVNTAGYVLDILGSPLILNQLDLLGIKLGALLSEMEMGTNGFGLAITERVPVEVRGHEHYRSQFHGIVEAAAPIFDITGKPLGAFGIINSITSIPNNSLALAASGARSIEAQRQADQLLKEQNNQLAHLNAILNTISEAILVWDREGILIQANPTAAELLNINFDPLKGRPILDQIQMPPFVTQAVRVEKELTDVEASLVIGSFHVNCILSLRFVRSTDGIRAVVAILRHAREIHQLIQRQIGTQAEYTLQDLVGVSSEIQRVRRHVTQAAGGQAAVMIRGEPGTGKNLLAQILHHHSMVKDGPFIVFSCTSIPGQMVVRELLGTEGGVNGYDGESRPGKIELADGGTLFFQDVDALPLEAQTILLNAMEMGFVQRIHSRRAIPVSVRVIASSSGDLERLVEQSSFRRDLYYRLSPFDIRLPPLRERIEDLPYLIESILKRLSALNNENFTISPEALALLQKYNWPLNLRELEAVLGRATSLRVGSEMISPQHLPEFIRQPNPMVFEPTRLISAGSLDEVEREALLQSAKAYQGSLTKMVGALGVSRTTLWRKLKQYDIHIQEYR